MLQAEGLSEVASCAHSVGLTVLVFTGYLLSELKEMGNDSIEKLLSEIDILIDGQAMYWNISWSGKGILCI